MEERCKDLQMNDTTATSSNALEEGFIVSNTNGGMLAKEKRVQ